MDKVLYYNELFSCYGELLTKKEQDLFSLYYEENLSMGEIAELKEVSRSGIGARIKRIEKKLEHYESIIHKRSIIKSVDKLNECTKLEDIKKAIVHILNY